MVEPARGAACSRGPRAHEGPGSPVPWLPAQTARRPLLLVCPRWGAAGRRTAGGIIPVVAWVFGGWSRPAISRDAIAAERGRNVEPAPSWGYGRCIACRVGGPHWEPLLGGSVGRGYSVGHPPAVWVGRRAGRRRPSPWYAFRKSFCIFERRFFCCGFDYFFVSPLYDAMAVFPRPASSYFLFTFFHRSACGAGDSAHSPRAPEAGEEVAAALFRGPLRPCTTLRVPVFFGVGTCS